MRLLSRSNECDMWKKFCVLVRRGVRGVSGRAEVRRLRARWRVVLGADAGQVVVVVVVVLSAF